MSKQINTRIFLSLFLISQIFISNAAFASDNFVDNEPGDKHYVAINYLKQIGIIDGYEDNTFRATEYVNRAEAVKMFMLANGKYTEEQIDTLSKDLPDAPFPDVSNDAWYSKYIKVAKAKGVINGYEDGTFKPENSIILAEALKVYLDSYGDLIFPLAEDHVFADSKPSDWYSKYVAFANSRGMIYITNNNEIYPEQELTRGYAAELIYRKRLFSEEYLFGKATYYGIAVQGHYTASGAIFDLNELTAAHKTLPFGTMVEVTNLANGKSVVVKITDRGPYGPGRVIDLTERAFSEISTLSRGVAYVQYKVVK